MKLLILRGLPASGKSTWAREFVEKNPDWIRINRDDLRNMRGRYWLPKQEKLITQFENSLIVDALENGYNVILDATNLNDDRNKHRLIVLERMYNNRFKLRNAVIEPEKMKTWEKDVKVEYKNFNIPVVECIERDMKRPNPVGRRVILDMYKKYFNEVKYDENPNLPHCVIFDIDGTLAKMTKRGPFDWDKVDTDELNLPVAKLYSVVYQIYNVIIFSGRDEICREKTEKWLENNNIFYDELFMRPKGNTEKDSIIKKRLFEEYIKGKYYVDFVVDDRQQVVDMWRLELGIPCFQADYGDF